MLENEPFRDGRFIGVIPTHSMLRTPVRCTGTTAHCQPGILVPIRFHKKGRLCCECCALYLPAVELCLGECGSSSEPVAHGLLCLAPV